MREPKMTAPFVHILSPEMAAAPEPQAAIDAYKDSESVAELKIAAALATPTSLEFVETPLKDVIDYLKDVHKIEIQLDRAGLKDAGVDESAPVNANIKGISLRSGLRLILDELQLKYVIHNEVLLITSPQKAESDEFMTTRLYPVKDLVLVRNDSGEIETDVQPLIDVITNTISSKSWVDNGGPGMISALQFQDRCVLTINQTQEVHENIADFLAALRRSGASGTSGMVEARLPVRKAKSPATAFGAPVVGGQELRLPQRPKYVPPTYYIVPVTPATPNMGTGMGMGGMGGGMGGGGMGGGGMGGGGMGGGMF